MKKLLLGIGLGIGVVIALVLAPIGFEPVERTSATTVASCPDGSYVIGYDENTNNPICKNEPTGCPYGDSIPLDSPKCAPSPEEKTKTKEGSNGGSNSEVRDTRSTESQEEQSKSCSSGK